MTPFETARALALVVGILAMLPLAAIGAELDTDDDGLPDTYEEANSLDKLEPLDALEDPDADGFSSLAEFQDGTDPGSATSMPATGGAPTIVAAVLPLSRSAQLDDTVTAFATILNADAVAKTHCSIAPSTPIPAEFYFHKTDPGTNAITGERNAPVDIPASGSATFVFGLTPRADMDSVEVALRFDCDNTAPAPSATGINTLLLSASSTPAPDVVALAATATLDGVLRMPNIANPGAFAVASVNVGAAGTLTVDAVTSVGGVTLSLCETNPQTGQCINPTVPAPTVAATINANATPTFSIFATAQQAVPLNAATNRIRVRFVDALGIVRGATGVAIEALASAPKLSELQTTIFTPHCGECHGLVPPPAGLLLAVGESFATLVNVNSVEVPSLKRVAPGDPENSYLIHKLEGRPGIEGLQMPRNRPPLSNADIQKVKDWIAAGALNN